MSGKCYRLDFIPIEGIPLRILHMTMSNDFWLNSRSCRVNAGAAQKDPPRPWKEISKINGFLMTLINGRERTRKFHNISTWWALFCAVQMYLLFSGKVVAPKTSITHCHGCLQGFPFFAPKFRHRKPFECQIWNEDSESFTTVLRLCQLSKPIFVTCFESSPRYIINRS